MVEGVYSKNTGTLYVELMNIEEYAELINKAKKEADQLQETINQLRMFDAQFRIRTNED